MRTKQPFDDGSDRDKQKDSRYEDGEEREPFRCPAYERELIWHWNCLMRFHRSEVLFPHCNDLNRIEYDKGISVGKMLKRPHGKAISSS